MKKALSFLLTVVMLMAVLILPASAAKVTVVNLTIQEPVVGEGCSFKATLPSNASTEVETVFWSAMDPNDPVFQQGKDYTVTIRVKIKDSSSNKFAALTSINATVNGSQAEVTEANTETITVKYTWKSVGGPAPETPESKLKDQLAALAAGFIASNGSTHRDVLKYLNEKLPDAIVWTAGGNYIYRRNQATETKDGFLNVDIGITYNDVTIQTYTFSSLIPALNKSPDATNIAADKALMEAAVKAFQSTAKTTADELLTAINAAAIHGTTAEWDGNYKYEASTATYNGSISGNLRLTLGEQKEQLSVYKSLPVDGTAVDAAIDSDKSAISGAIYALNITNSTEQETLVNAAKAAIKNGSALTCTGFKKEVATYDAAGKIQIAFYLELSGVTRNFYVNIDLPKLRSTLPAEISVTQDEWELLRLVNIERFKNGSMLLTMPGALQDSTDIRAEEIVAVYDSSHMRPDGSSCLTAIDPAFAENRALGENMYKGITTPSAAMEGWMNSSGHRTNILYKDYAYLGCGVTGSYNYKYWVQQFASGNGIHSAESSTGSLRFATVEEMETAYLICHSGDITSYVPLDTEYMTKNGNQYTIYLKGISVTAAVGYGFDDVPADAYYADAVTWAVNNGVTNGTGEYTFSPDMTCTRSQVVTFLWRAQGMPEPQSIDCPFTDVTPSDYYYKAVLWAVEQGITAGTGAATFSPDATCTSAQVVTFLYRANNPGAYMESAEPYYANAVTWAEQNGLLSGTAAAFSPDRNAPRSDIVYYLYRNDR